MTRSPSEEIVLVHSSDLHVDSDHTEPTYGDDGTTGLRVVLDAARTHDADFVLLVGDVFDSNRQKPEVVRRAATLLREVERPVVILPGNHDPLTPDSVYLRDGLAEIPHVHIIGLTHELAVHFPEHDL
ncbi:MAG TPA: metallophosphoesterase, partial [Acetobacteraceae bacterium]|nr:metallophosphoesterase [Acetobacteraceae bacterium]